MSPLATWLIERGVAHYVAGPVAGAIEASASQFGVLSDEKAALAWQAAVTAMGEFLGVGDVSAFLDELERAGHMTPAMRARIRGLAN